MINSRELRDRILPFPEGEEYRKVLLLGTTGSGKSTLIRQLIGGSSRESFPTTSTARTTIADTEIILAPGPYQAVVTFFERGYIVEQVRDCIVEAALAAHRGDDRTDLQRALLEHPEQRFRFKYTLGEGPAREVAADDLATDLLAPSRSARPTRGMAELGELDLDPTNTLIATVLDLTTERARAIGAELRDRLAAEPDDDDDRPLSERVDDELEAAIRADEALASLADELVGAMLSRTGLIPRGELHTELGWPASWTFATNNREQLIAELKRLTSIAKPGWGRLLTPLVSGVRVSGPFAPTWHDGNEIPLILLDTEGLGHVQSSSASIPVKVSRQIAEADAVLLVDNAQQPMQAAPAALMQALVRSGHGRKLFLGFTHFDHVAGENLPTLEDRQRHVVNPCLGVVRAIRQDLGEAAVQPLVERIRNNTYYLGGLQNTLNDDEHFETIESLQDLIKQLASSGGRPTLADTRPIYDEANAIIAVRDGIARFHHQWKALLGIQAAEGVDRAHWGTVKALSRRLAENSETEYKHLRPIADLHRMLLDELGKAIQHPAAWSAGEPTSADAQNLYDEYMQELGNDLLDLVTTRILDNHEAQWLDVYWLAGKGSTFERARRIQDDIYEHAAPIPGATAARAGGSTGEEPQDRNSNELLGEIRDIVRRTAKDLGIAVR
ncbi:hypothetical protein HT102_04715 [Hoyosella sp. G463]|uniref:AAA+ ATPase domain-containing protein n=1 Tax=Lolliginicoccus lacisalsi TaxID=2742202 RepID=A0A927JB07_9ACTN|nr:hypothetical protein [Lolliginicoccus lacisalsi]MBD8505786.1 hypothetical protein [Lolliginicoccus lacisalsi]